MHIVLGNVFSNNGGFAWYRYYIFAFEYYSEGIVRVIFS